MRKHLNWPIFAKSSERLRDRPLQTDLLFSPKLNEKPRGNIIVVLVVVVESCY